MQSVNELQRRPSPAGHPQPLAALGGTIFAGSWDSDAIHPIDAATWAAGPETKAPGKPYGMAVLGGAIRVVVAIGDDDDRYLTSFVPGKGFDPQGQVALPDLSGSHLASDGTTLYLLQMGKRQLVTLDASGAVLATYPLSTRLAGIGFAGGTLYGIAGDDEFEDLHLATIELGGAEPVVTNVAKIPDEARGLAFDGSAWWTSLRDEDLILSFTV